MKDVNNRRNWVHNIFKSKTVIKKKVYFKNWKMLRLGNSKTFTVEIAEENNVSLSLMK